MSKAVSASPSEKYLDITLLRHGHSTANAKGILAGRDNSIHLSDLGTRQALALVDVLKSKKFDRIITSPITRCKETLKPLLQYLDSHTSGSRTEYAQDKRLIEMDYGLWSGRKLSTLAKKSEWSEIQRRPSSVRFPEGESFLEMQSRLSDLFSELFSEAKKPQSLLLCSHGDVIKAALAQFLGLHLDQFQRIVIDPASISQIRLTKGGAFVIRTNDISHLTSISPRLGSEAKRRDGVRATLGGGAG